MARFFLFFLWVLGASTDLSAQANTGNTNNGLPNMEVITNKGQNLLSWYCQYDGVKSIAIQRSVDSVRNFTSIGIMTSPKKGKLTFKDTHPKAGKNYYRLSVMFQSDLEWFSNTYFAVVDSADIINAQQTILKGDTNQPDANTPNVNPEKTNTLSEEGAGSSKEFYFTPSSKIYTNPYTGHININLEDPKNHRYSIRFYDPSNNEVLRISRVMKGALVLDKNNFNSRGIYSFKLFDGSSLVESGYVSIY